MSVKKPLIAFNYFGSKANHLEWVLEYLPHSRNYVEVFGGSAVVLLNKRPCRVETYNDLNGAVVNFFKVLRDQPEELLWQLYLTPYSRDEYWNAYELMNTGTDLERARRFFIVINQSFSATVGRLTGWKISTNVNRCGISDVVNRMLKKVDNLPQVVERLRRVQISNFSFQEVFTKFTTQDTLLYCDPPYLHEVRSGRSDYVCEMSITDHEELLRLANKSKCQIAISGYENDLYMDLLKGWTFVRAGVKRDTMFHSARQECLWMNYDVNERKELF